MMTRYELQTPPASVLLRSCPPGIDDRYLTNPRNPQLLHLHRELEQVVQALAHRLRLVHIVAPDIDAMPPHKHCKRVGEFLHGLLHELGKILLVRRVLDNGDPQRVVVPKVAHLAEAAPEALDLLNVVDLEDAAAGPVGGGLEDEGDEDGPVRVRVDAAAGVAAREGGEEEGGALRGLEGGRRAEVGARGGGDLVGKGEDIDVRGLHELLLHAGGGDVDEVAGRVSEVILRADSLLR